MGWASAVKTRPTKVAKAVQAPVGRPAFPIEQIDWDRLVSLDFETKYDEDYTLSKLSTSEYVRDPRFEALMVGIKVGRGKTKVVPGHKVRAELRKIPWASYSLLCHNVQFDGFILSHHYGVKPKKYYCSLSMARGLFSNDIGAGLDEVARHLGGEGKLESGTEDFKGFDLKRLLADKPRYARAADYCGQDVDEMLRIFKVMVNMVPRDEMDLIHVICRMFCDPVLRVDIPRVETELAREIAERRAALLGLVDEKDYAADIKKLLKNTAERELTGDDRKILLAKRVVGSSERFANLIRAEGIEPPVKLSAAWMKKPASERNDDDKWTYAFAKDDHEFINLPDQVEELSAGLNLNKKADIAKLAARQERLRALVDARLAVKSTTNITRAERFLVAGANGMPLPVGYAYYRAHTGRLGGANKMNMQNLKRGGELRKSILAPLNHVIGVVDSGQIEARVNAWLWGQDDLLDAFRAADGWDKDVMGIARGADRDAYCKFGDLVYGREITTDDKTERFVGKVCVLGLGYQMGAPKLQITLAKGALGGPPVYFELDKCHAIVNAYRRKNHRIQWGWEKCAEIIEDMACGRAGSWGPISWEEDTIWLPNGMALKYPDLKKRMGDKGWDEWTYQGMLKGTPVRKKIYGGLLCENIVQALARIIVMGQLLQIDTKYRVVMTTHDENVAVIKKASAETAMRFMLKVMRTPPSWCADIPLNAEGGYAENYSK